MRLVRDIKAYECTQGLDTSHDHFMPLIIIILVRLLACIKDPSAT